MNDHTIQIPRSDPAPGTNPQTPHQTRQTRQCRMHPLFTMINNPPETANPKGTPQRAKHTCHAAPTNSPQGTLKSVMAAPEAEGLASPNGRRRRCAALPSGRTAALEQTHKTISLAATRQSKWWSLTGSNRRHPACKAGALPAELRPLGLAARGQGFLLSLKRRRGPPPAWLPAHKGRRPVGLATPGRRPQTTDERSNDERSSPAPRSQRLRKAERPPALMRRTQRADARDRRLRLSKEPPFS